MTGLSRRSRRHLLLSVVINVAVMRAVTANDLTDLRIRDWPD